MKIQLRSIKLSVNKKFVNIAIFSLAFAIIFLSSIFFRVYLTGNASLPGQEAYFNVNTAESILDFKGNFVLNNFAFAEIAWPLVIAGFSLVTWLPPEITIVILSFIFGILSVIFIYLILEKLEFKKKKLTLAFFLISPVTIWLFSTFSKFILPFFLAILALYFLLTERKFASMVAIVIASLFGVISSISVLILTIIGYKKGYWKWIWKVALLSLAINFIFYLFFPNLANFSFELKETFGLFFALSEFGVSMFAFLLAILGIVGTWKERRERKEFFLIYIAFISLFILSSFNKSFVFFFNFSLIFLASLGFSKLWERDWASMLIKNLTIGLLIVGVLFPLIFMPLRIAASEPGEELISAIESLKVKDPGKVLNVKENGYWIKSFSGQEAFVDEFTSRIDPSRNQKSKEFLLERNLDSLVNGFKQEEIRYVLLDSKARKLFRTQDEGILLLLQHGEIFKQIYNENGIEIWEFDLEKVAQSTELTT